MGTAGSPLRGAVANAFYIDDIYQKGIGGLFAGIILVVGNGIDPFGIDGIVNGVGALAQKGSSGHPLPAQRLYAAVRTHVYLQASRCFCCTSVL